MSNNEGLDVIKMGQEIREELGRARDWNAWAYSDEDCWEPEWETSVESLWNTYKELFPAFAKAIERRYEQ